MPERVGEWVGLRLVEGSRPLMQWGGEWVDTFALIDFGLHDDFPKLERLA